MSMLKTSAAFALILGVAAAMQAIVASAASAPAGAPRLIDVTVLSERRVSVKNVSKPAAPGTSFFAATIIDAPVEKLCTIIQDYADYPSFMPNMRKARVVHSAEDYSLVDMTLRVPFGQLKKYRVKMEPRTSERSCRLFWKLVPSEDLKPEETIADTSGYWQLTPHPSHRNKTVVEYFVYANPGSVPVGLGWIEEIVSRNAPPKTLEGLREKAQAQADGG